MPGTPYRKFAARSEEFRGEGGGGAVMAGKWMHTTTKNMRRDYARRRECQWGSNCQKFPVALYVLPWERREETCDHGLFVQKVAEGKTSFQFRVAVVGE